MIEHIIKKQCNNCGIQYYQEWIIKININKTTWYLIKWNSPKSIKEIHLLCFIFKSKTLKVLSHIIDRYFLYISHHLLYNWMCKKLGTHKEINEAAMICRLINKPIKKNLTSNLYLSKKVMFNKAMFWSKSFSTSVRIYSFALLYHLTTWSFLLTIYGSDNYTDNNCLQTKQQSLVTAINKTADEVISRHVTHNAIRQTPLCQTFDRHFQELTKTLTVFTSSQWPQQQVNTALNQLPLSLHCYFTFFTCTFYSTSCHFARFYW